MNFFLMVMIGTFIICGFNTASTMMTENSRNRSKVQKIKGSVYLHLLCFHIPLIIRTGQPVKQINSRYSGRYCCSRIANGHSLHSPGCVNRKGK